MPTGYTAEVADGKVTDFRTFALLCARAFGATFGAAIMQRDDPMHDPPKHREPSSFYAENVARDEARVAELAAMTSEDAARASQAEYDAAMVQYHDSVEKRTQTRNRYNAMLAEVMQWEPPTLEHIEMKEFMIDQLTESRKFDDYKPAIPLKRKPDVWLAESRVRASASLARSRESLTEEMERCAKSNEWIGALYRSLSPVLA